MVSAEDTAREVERAARALGVWWDDGDAPQPIAGQWTLSRLAWTASDYEVKRWLEPGQDQARWEPCFVDWTVAAVILLGHRRGLRVDIGECPACRVRSGKRGPALWEWSQYTTNSQAALLSWIARHSADVGWSHKRQESTGAADMFGMAITRFTAKRPCPACTINGQPTGRHTLAWERAILDAMPDDAERRTARFLAALDSDGPETGIDDRIDPATRTALTVLAHRLADPEHAAVFGDWLAEHRDPAAFPAPREGLAAVLHAWLAGSCQVCGGSGRLSARTGQPLAAGGTWWADDIGGCQACHGHGVTLGRFDGEIVSMLREISQAAGQDASEAAQ